MVLPGHIAGGYLSTSIILNFLNIPFSTNEFFILYLIGILAGEIPDIDLLAFYNEKNSKKTTHREFITHLPIFWLFICTIIFIYGYLINSNFILTISLLILGGTFSHFIFDSIEYGIQWFGPFSKKRYCIYEIKQLDLDNKDKKIKTGSIKYYWKYITTTYLKQYTFYFEIIVVLIAIYIFFT